MKQLSLLTKYVDHAFHLKKKLCNFQLVRFLQMLQRNLANLPITSLEKVANLFSEMLKKSSKPERG